jgi:hypothetical protein
MVWGLGNTRKARQIDSVLWRDVLLLEINQTRKAVDGGLVDEAWGCAELVFSHGRQQMCCMTQGERASWMGMVIMPGKSG